MPRLGFIARALLGWGPWVLLPLFTMQATGAEDAALAAAAGVAVLWLFYRLSKDPPPPKVATSRPGTLTVPLDEAKPLRPARDITENVPANRAALAAARRLTPSHVNFEIASAPLFIAVGYFLRDVSGDAWGGAFLRAGLVCAVFFGLAASVDYILSRERPDRTPAVAGWGPLVPLVAGAFSLLALVFPEGLLFFGGVVIGVLVIAFVVQDIKDVWEGTGRHRR